MNIRGTGLAVDSLPLICDEQRKVHRGNTIYTFQKNVPIWVKAQDAEELLRNPSFHIVDSIPLDKVEVRKVPSQFHRILCVAKQLNTVKSPLVSVVIPSYNYGHHIEECIKSILLQSFTDFEVLVMDGGSTDNTEEVALGIQNNKISFFSLKGKTSVSDARNYGIFCSRGDLVTFLDADDTFTPNRLMLQVEAFLNDKDLDMVWGNARPMEGPVRGIELSGPPDIEKLMRADYIPSCSVMLKKSTIFKHGLYDPRLPAAEDWDYYLRLLCGGVKGLHLNEFLYNLRWHPNSKTIRDSKYINSQKYMDGIRDTSTRILKAQANKGLKRVLFVLPDNSKGGANIATLDLIKRLDKEEFKSYVYLMRGGNTYVTDELDELKVDYKVQKETYRHIPITGDPGDVKRIKDYMKKNDINILHNVVIVAAKVAAKELGIPVVQMRHQIEYSMNTSDNIHVSISEAGREGEQVFDHSHVIYNGLDTVLFSRDEYNGNLLRTSLGVSPNEKLVLWAGRLHDDKGPRYAAQVIAASENKFLFIHVNDDSNYDKFLESLKGYKNVIIKENVSREELPTIYSACDFVLNTSKTEGNGLVIMEGMLCGCVPVAFCVGGIPEIVMHGYNGFLVEPYNTDEMANIIDSLDKETLIKMSLNAQESKKRFNLCDTVTRMENIYREAVSCN